MNTKTSINAKEFIAKRIAMECKDGNLGNLGAGLPGLVAQFIPKDLNIWLHSENGIIGVGPKPGEESVDIYCVDSSNKFCTILPGGSTFESSFSFGIARGGHLDFTVLGALQVDEEGNLANWGIPGGKIIGMGGAMDLVSGAKRVIVATEHCAKDGSPKIKKKCDYPLTGEKVVDLIVTELAVIEVSENGLVLKEMAPWTIVEEIVNKTEANLVIPEKIRITEVL